MSVHDFQESLAQSHAASDLPFWEEAYKNAFPTFQTMVDHRKDGTHQRAGVDRSVILESGRCIWVDEKIRGKNKSTGLVYDDIALEFVSNDRANAAGWVEKPLLCDYIAYAIAPLGKCYLLPVEQLQAAWAKNCDKWKQKYGVRRAPNKGYCTLFTAVPPSVLYPAIGSLLRVTFSPVAWEEAS